MALSTEAPDPRTFKSWEDAFQYPIPVIRKLEQQLRTHADDNREKLRSLVGASYRSLLDTAETIIDMEVRMDEVETKLSRVGQSCNSRGVERIAKNAVTMDTYAKNRDAERYRFASQVSVLRNAPLVMTRLMRSEGSYLLIAKVLVISRLVYKALGNSAHKPPIVEQQWERLLSVRRKLLRRIDKRLSSPTGETETLVESMCAYALATSSTPTDVLNHFHKVRLERINGELRMGGDQLANHGTSALKLCIQTCLDTQTIFPRRLAEALAKLKAHPLIQDPDVRGLYELNLDVHDRWIGDEARNYTPYPRHDELQRPEAEKILHRWSKNAISNFLKGIKEALESEERLREVANLRSELIETWILSGSRMAGVKSTNVLDNLRDIMNEKLETIVRSRSRGLESVVTRLRSQLEFLPSRTAFDTSLWNTTSKASDLGDGAKLFKSTILNTYQGRDESVTSVTSAFDKWMESILEVKGIVKSMKEARWDDTFADDADEGSDDDNLGESKQTLLSDDDPRLLEEVTQEAMSDALQNLGQGFSNIAGASDTEEGDGLVRKASFILRVVREIGDRIPRLRLQDRSTALASPFTNTIVQPLYMALASHVVKPSMRAYKRSLAASLRSKSNSHVLWEGQPPLPSQPSTGAFRFLRELNKSMAALGSDLWAPGGVTSLKELVFDELRKAFAQHLDAITTHVSHKESASDTPEAQPADVENAADTECKEDAPSSSQSNELRARRLKQLAFDALYLQRFTAPGGEATELVSASQLAMLQVGVLDDAARTRLKKNAAEYAKQSYLLFALLA